ncbi:MAG: hypothetical protein AAGF12_39270 [Myxococcota bacterium]
MDLEFSELVRNASPVALTLYFGTLAVLVLTHGAALVLGWPRRRTPSAMRGLLVVGVQLAATVVVPLVQLYVLVNWASQFGAESWALGMTAQSAPAMTVVHIAFLVSVGYWITAFRE